MVDVCHGCKPIKIVPSKCDSESVDIRELKLLVKRGHAIQYRAGMRAKRKRHQQRRQLMRNDVHYHAAGASTSIDDVINKNVLSQLKKDPPRAQVMHCNAAQSPSAGPYCKLMPGTILGTMQIFMAAATSLQSNYHRCSLDENSRYTKLPGCYNYCR